MYHLYHLHLVKKIGLVKEHYLVIRLNYNLNQNYHQFHLHPYLFALLNQMEKHLVNHKLHRYHRHYLHYHLFRHYHCQDIQSSQVGKHHHHLNNHHYHHLNQYNLELNLHLNH